MTDDQTLENPQQPAPPLQLPNCTSSGRLDTPCPLDLGTKGVTSAVGATLPLSGVEEYSHSLEDP